MNQRFTLDRHSFEHLLAAASLFQSLQRTAVSQGVTNNPPLLHFSLETLRAVDSGALDLQSALERVAGLALQIVGGNSAVAWLFIRDSMICRAAAGTNVDDNHLQTALRLRLQSAGAFETKPPSTLDLSRTLTNFSVALGPSLTIALLPGRGIAGAIAVFSDPSRTFTERDYTNLRLLAGLAQYILAKWMAAIEDDSLEPAQEWSEQLSLQTRIASALERSATAPLIPRAPDPVSRPLREIPQPGNDRMVRAEVPPDRSHPEPQCIPAFAASGDLEVHSPVAHPPVTHSPIVNSPVTDSPDQHSPANDSLGEPVRQLGPEEPNDNSPALQRWEKWKERFKSRWDDWIVSLTPDVRSIARRLTLAVAGMKNVLPQVRAVGFPWRPIAQAAPAIVILAVMSLFVGFLMGGHQPLTVGPMNPVAQAAAEPASKNLARNLPSTLIEKKSPPATGPTSHLQITDRETAATVAELSKFEVRNLQRIANFGDDEAALQLGMLYELGRGFPQNCRKAAEWVIKSAHDGNVAAQYNLGLRYKDGDGVSANLQQAQLWLSKAAARKNQNAARVLAELPLPSPEPSGAQITMSPHTAVQTP